MMSNYNKEIDKPSSVYSIADFKQHCEDKAFTDYDGFGYAVKDGKMDEQAIVKPSRLSKIPSDATHIVWFNR